MNKQPKLCDAHVGFDYERHVVKRCQKPATTTYQYPTGKRYKVAVCAECLERFKAAEKDRAKA